MHCGLGFGIIAGLDVGHNGRWEYLLAGSPLNEVASAESEAEKGDLVVSSSVYDLLKSNGEFRETFRGNYRVIHISTSNKSAVKGSPVLRAAYDFEYGLSQTLSQHPQSQQSQHQLQHEGE